MALHQKFRGPFFSRLGYVIQGVKRLLMVYLWFSCGFHETITEFPSLSGSPEKIREVQQLKCVINHAFEITRFRQFRFVFFQLLSSAKRKEAILSFEP